MDAGAMTKLARSWKTVPSLHYCSVNLGPELSYEIIGSSERSFQVDVSKCLGTVNFVEQVQLKVTYSLPGICYLYALFGLLRICIFYDGDFNG